VSAGEDEKKTQRVANVRKFASEGGEKREGKEREKEKKRERERKKPRKAEEAVND